jgi:hypothetical protein
MKDGVAVWSTQELGAERLSEGNDDDVAVGLLRLGPVRPGYRDHDRRDGA